MPDTAIPADCECHHSVVSRPRPISTDKPQNLRSHSTTSSLHQLHVRSLILPLPCALQPQQSYRASNTSSDNALFKDAIALSISLTLHVDVDVTATATATATVSAFADANADDSKHATHPHTASTLIDWTALVAQLHFITQHYPTDSLDTLARVIATYLCHSNQLTTLTPAAAPSPVRQLTLDIALLAQPTSTPSRSHRYTHTHTHSITIAQSDVASPAHEHNGWGDVDVLIETIAPSAGLYLLHLSPHRSIPPHVHRVMGEAEMVLTNGLHCRGTPARWGAVHAWGQAVHSYTNDSAQPAAVLCIDTPAFIPADEIVVAEQTLAAVDEQHAGHPVWQQLARSILDTSSSSIDSDSARPSFTFPGCYADQTCRLSFDVSAAQPAAAASAVLIFVVSPPVQHTSSSAPRLLFVRHRVRGFELPGGKVEAGETERQAAVREVREEAGVVLSEQTLLPIAQYVLTEHGNTTAAPHVKSVFVAMVDEPAATTDSEHRWQETDRAEWRELPCWSDIVVGGADGWSVLLRDNVYAICSRVVEEMWRQKRQRG